jgi:hypothetical protein
MAGHAPSALRIAGITILAISIVLQVLGIAVLSLGFDPRTSCDRLSYWSEWIACMHGQSHLHVVAAEIAIFGWILGAVAGTLGRFRPRIFPQSFPPQWRC